MQTTKRGGKVKETGDGAESGFPLGEQKLCRCVDDLSV